MKKYFKAKLTDGLAWAFIGILIALVILPVVAASLFFFPGNRIHESSKSLADYERFIHRSYPIHGILFPDEGLLDENNCIFYDRYLSDGLGAPESLTYALCVFSEEEFERELSRLGDLASEYSETYFQKPAYILCLHHVADSEYALVDEAGRAIHYVYYSTDRFLDRLPDEDRLRPEYADAFVDYRDFEYYLERWKESGSQSDQEGPKEGPRNDREAP